MMRGWLIVALAACGHDHFDPAHNYAFVTSTVHDPATFGADLSGADAICRTAASNEGLLGDYVAYLSATIVNAPSRLGNARGWIRLDGAPFVDRVADLVSGNMLYPLRIDETGADLVDGGGPVASGTNADGTPDFGCSDWTSSIGAFAAGFGQFTSTGWIHAQMAPCTTLARIYCFGTSYDAPLDVSPASGRRMFVSEQTFVPGGGIAAADALCASEASLAGISGTFLALLPPAANASAASRFDLTGPNWVRLDGVPVAESSLAFMAGQLSASPNVSALGNYTNFVVLTAGLPSQNAEGGVNCTNWTDSAAGVPSAGRANISWTGAFDSVSGTCAGGQIYCMEP